MKCTRDDCFAYTTLFQNNCSALHSVAPGCRFYKTKKRLDEEREALIRNGKPYFAPAKTNKEKMLLAKLLNNERTGDMDKT